MACKCKGKDCPNHDLAAELKDLMANNHQLARNEDWDVLYRLRHHLEQAKK